MNFKKLSQDKQKRLLLTVLATVLAIAGLGFGVVKPQYQYLANLAAKRAAVERERDRVKNAVKCFDQIQAELIETRKSLAATEVDVARGDLYSWVIDALRRFKAGYKVEIPQFSPLGPMADVNLLPEFPYKQASLAISGTACYHDFGKFLADLENHFPHFRVLNLEVELNPAAGTTEPESLAFRMDIAVLVKNEAT